MSDHIEGFEVPIHRSLTTPILIMGVPRAFAILNGTFLSAIVFGLHSLYVIPVCLFLHVLAIYATKKDEQFFEVFKRMIKHKTFYRA